MAVPVLRVVPAWPAGQVDPLMPLAAWFGADQDTVAHAADELGLEAHADGETLRVAATVGSLAALRSLLANPDSPVAAALDRYLSPVPAWKLRTVTLPLDRPHIMGIVNLTEDSFSGDGVGASIAAALRRAAELREAGADIIDVGAETARADRPGVDAEAEARLAAPVIEALVQEGHLVSIDTYKPLVARTAIERGAEIVNDISGLTLGTGAAAEAARAGVGYVLNYSYSVPKRRPDIPPRYTDVVAETIAWMATRLAELRSLGLPRAAIAADPGIAFGKSHDEDIQVIRRFAEFTTLGQPLLLAHSRKNYIGSVTGLPPAARDLETHVTSVLALAAGARIFRVHDAAGARRALDMAAALLFAVPGAFAPDGESWPWRAGASAAHMTRQEPDRPPPAGQRW
jgi:dihydropteroate synthase